MRVHHKPKAVVEAVGNVVKGLLGQTEKPEAVNFEKEMMKREEAARASLFQRRRGAGARLLVGGLPETSRRPTLLGS